MVVSGVWCFSIYLFYIVIAELVPFNVRVRLSVVTGFVALAIAVHVSAWRFAAAHRRDFVGAELRWFTFSCFAAFWLIDELLVLVRNFISDEHGVAYEVTRAILASAFDLAMVAVIVYVTVPWAMKRYLTHAVA